MVTNIYILNTQKLFGLNGKENLYRKRRLHIGYFGNLTSSQGK